MTATAEYYAQMGDTFGDTESLTVLVVAGANRGRVAAALGVDLSAPVEPPDDVETTSWALVDIPGRATGDQVRSS